SASSPRSTRPRRGRERAGKSATGARRRRSPCSRWRHSCSRCDPRRRASGGEGRGTLMGRRRKAREVALQVLYQPDLHDEDDPSAHAADFWSQHPVDDDTRAFASALVEGAKRRQAEIDKMIGQYTEHWDLERMAVVDRNILRLAVYELLDTGTAPPK